MTRSIGLMLEDFAEICRHENMHMESPGFSRLLRVVYTLYSFCSSLGLEVPEIVSHCLPGILSSPLECPNAVPYLIFLL